jgi:hypothetical protein
MTYRELDAHLMEQLDHEVRDMRKVSWQDLEKLHMLTSVLSLLWHPAMKSRMDQQVQHGVLHHHDTDHHNMNQHEGSYLKTAEQHTTEAKPQGLY